MGLIKRMVDVVISNANDLLDKAENSEKLLKQAIREMDDAIDKAKAEMARILSEAHPLEKQAEQKAKDAGLWEKRAKMAVDGGDDELARKALERKLAYQQDGATLQEQVVELRQAADKIKGQVSEMETKMADAQNRYKALAARGTAAKTVEKAQKKMVKLQDQNKAMGRFEKLERKVQNAEACADASIAANEADKDVAQTFEKQEKDLALEAELAALKAKQ